MHDAGGEKVEDSEKRNWKKKNGATKERKGGNWHSRKGSLPSSCLKMDCKICASEGGQRGLQKESGKETPRTNGKKRQQSGEFEAGSAKTIRGGGLKEKDV